MPSASYLLLVLFLTATPALADIYVHRDSQGVLHFTNVPNHSGYRAVIRESGGSSPLATLVPGRIEEIIRSASGRYGVDPDLVRAVIKAESDFNSQARSPKGARGLMQLMPETARLHSVNNIYDPGQNIEGGVRHLRLLLDRYEGDLRLALAGYNAGTQAVEKYGGVPPYPETREYIRRVLGYHQRYRGNGTISIREEVRR
ncbi:MAG: lytic transglycosylase domain-containing protein [Deltaproteobacteria bacterium]|nr:lytic transglycosylase domain-containing protein [Deltaproteobacteria bacterium]